MLKEESRVRGSWRKLYNEELHNMYFSASNIRTIKSKRMKLKETVARM
jgi:hypothetical protein